MATNDQGTTKASGISAGSPFHKEEVSRWVQTEFESSDLGDGRLNERLKVIVESFFAMPNGSIPEACRTRANTKGAYRFLSNAKVTHEKILAPHREATNHRIALERIILAIQDTTTLNYTHLRETEGLGPISTLPTLRGILVHTTLAITPGRNPLGIIHQHAWVRKEEEYGKRRLRKERLISEKESQKWLNSLAACEEVRKGSPDTVIINIGDREADVYELFHEAKTNYKGCHLLVRASWDRRVDHPERYLWSHMENVPVATVLEVAIPRKSKKPGRTASLAIRYDTVTLNPPSRLRKHDFSSISLNAVYVHEASPPLGEEALSWMLLTTLPIESVEDAAKCSEHYAHRFSIEIFHKILKSGCRVEERQLESAEGLLRCLALDSIVACKIMSLTFYGRAVPDLPCTVVFEDDEWRSLYCFMHKTQEPPDTPLSLLDATRLLARLGGFLGRKGDGHPGAMVLWRGMQKLVFIAASWRAFGPRTRKKHRLTRRRQIRDPGLPENPVSWHGTGLR